MRTLQILVLVLMFSFNSGLGASAGQIPVLVDVQIADGDDPIQSFERSGTLSGVSMTATWTVNDFHAEFTVSGHGNLVWVCPHFILVWEDTGGIMPLSVNVTSNTTGPYTLLPVFQLDDETDPDLSMIQKNITTSTYLGHYFPGCVEVYFEIGLDNESALYDITATLDWGPGVPTESTSWGQVKSLFR